MEIIEGDLYPISYWKYDILITYILKELAINPSHFIFNLLFNLLTAYTDTSFILYLYTDLSHDT